MDALQTTNEIGQDVAGQQTGLHLPTPFSAVLLSTLIFGFLHLASPYSFAESYEYRSWLVLILNLLAISSPAILLRFKRRGPALVAPADPGMPKDRRVLHVGVWILLGLSWLGVILKCYDLFFARGFSLSSDVNELYEQNSEISASLAGLVASLLYPLAYPALIIVFALRRDDSGGKMKWRLGIVLALLACLVAPLNAVALGKRGAVFTLAILVSLACYYYGIRLRKRTVALSVVAAFLLVLFSARMLSHRLELKGASSEGAVAVGRFTDLLELNSGYRAIARYSAMPKHARSTMYDWAAFHAYVVHAVPEYLYAIEKFNPAEHQNGRFTFSLAAKFFSYFTNVHYDAGETASVPPRTYIYTMLFGPLFFDFGLGSIVVSAILGLGFVLVYRRAQHSVFSVPLYLYLYTVVLLCPMICFLSMFYGFYYFAACISAGIFLNFCSNVRI